MTIGSDGRPCPTHDTYRADVKEVYFAGDHTVGHPILVRLASVHELIPRFAAR